MTPIRKKRTLYTKPYFTKKIWANWSVLSQVKTWKWLIVRNIPWASDLSGNVWTKNFDSRHSSPPCHRLGCKYFFDSFAHLGWYHCTCLWPCFCSSWAVKCDIWQKQQPELWLQPDQFRQQSCASDYSCWLFPCV